MGRFAVIDTETNWVDRVMSIGCCIADEEDFAPLEMKYHVLGAECEIGGMYERELFLETPVPPVVCTREEAVEDLAAWLAGRGVEAVFAYNAAFDRSHLPELRALRWYDIMRVAAYRQHNPAIPASAACFSTGRMKRGYGVEEMLRLLRGEASYRETHNALFDALDELEIMRRLGRKIAHYPPL